MSDKLQHLYTIKPARLAMLTTGATEEELEVLQGHVTYLEELVSKGIVFLAGRTQTADPDTFGIVIIDLADEIAVII